MNEISQQEATKQDKFWLYVGLTAVVLITTLWLVKMNENEKFAPIKEQIQEEEALMNIRVLK